MSVHQICRRTIFSVEQLGSSSPIGEFTKVCVHVCVYMCVCVCVCVYVCACLKYKAIESKGTLASRAPEFSIH